MSQGRRKAKKRTREPSAEKAVLKFLDRHLSRDFPNPKRRGCPNAELLELTAFGPQHVEQSVVRHLFHCSPCYKRFSAFLQKIRAAVPPKLKPC